MTNKHGVRIYLDVDGVVADFVGATAKLFDFDPAVVDRWDYYPAIGHTEQTFWDRIKSAGVDFWRSIEPYEWANELLAKLNEVGPVTLLTAPPPRTDIRGQMIAGRVDWIHARFGDRFENYFVGRPKERLAAPDAVLVDDSDANFVDFCRAGGHGILFPQPWNANRHATNDRIKHVLEYL